VMLPKSLMNFRRLMGFISLAESHLLEAYYGLQARAMRRIAARWGVHVCRGSKAAATADGDAWLYRRKRTPIGGVGTSVMGQEATLRPLPQASTTCIVSFKSCQRDMSTAP